MRREASAEVIPKPTIMFNSFLNKPTKKQQRLVVSHSVMSPSRSQRNAEKSKITVNLSSTWKNNGTNITHGSILGGLQNSSLLSADEFMHRSKMNASTMSSQQTLAAVPQLKNIASLQQITEAAAKSITTAKKTDSQAQSPMLPITPMEHEVDHVQVRKTFGNYTLLNAVNLSDQ